MFSALRKRSTTFRLALGFMGIFSVSFLILGLFVYLQATSYLEADLQAAIEINASDVAGVFQRDGIEGLVSEIEDRVQRNPQDEYIYLVVDQDCRPIAGRLDRQPPAELIEQRCEELLSGEEWFDFELGEEVSPFMSSLVFARLMPLSDDFSLLYGSVMGELDVLEETILAALLWSFILMLLLGLTGSVLMSRNVAARLEKLNRTSREIRLGNLSSRMPVDSHHDEFDRLALNLNEMLDQIEALMEGIREVSNSIAHDLRTPLTRLSHDLEELLVRLPPEPHLKESVEHAIAETDKLLRTFNALLSIAQIEAGSRRRDFEEMDLVHVVTDVVEFYWPLAAEKGVTLRRQLGNAAGFLGDQDLISQAISNLVDNAIKYTPPGGEVTVALEDGARGLRLLVADTGPGIPESERANVFNRFYRLDAYRDSAGSGLGLSLVAAVVKLHDSTIALESNNPGLRVSWDLPPSASAHANGSSTG